MLRGTLLALLFVLLVACGEEPPTESPARSDSVVVGAEIEVEAWLPDRSAVAMEAEAAVPLEQALAALEGVRRTTTRCEKGRCVVRLTLHTGIDVTAMRDRVQARLRGLDGVPAAIEVTLRARQTKDSHLVLLLEPTDDAPPRAGSLRRAARAIVASRLRRQRGVSDVEVRGGMRSQCLVRFDASRLAAFDVTPVELAEAVGHASRRSDGVRHPTVDEVRDTVVATRAGEPVRLRDLALVRVEPTAVEPGADGGVSVLVTLQPGTSASTLETVIAGLELPEGVRLRVAEPSRPSIVVWVAAGEQQQGIPPVKQAHALVLPVPGVGSATVHPTVDEPEVVVALRQELSKALGVSDSDVTATIQLALAGRSVGTVASDGEPVALVVRAGEDRSADLEILKDLRIRARSGGVLPLSSVASLRLVRVPAVLFRLGSSRAALVRIQPAEDADTDEVVAAVRQAVAGLHAEVFVEWS